MRSLARSGDPISSESKSKARHKQKKQYELHLLLFQYRKGAHLNNQHLHFVKSDFNFEEPNSPLSSNKLRAALLAAKWEGHESRAPTGRLFGCTQDIHEWAKGSIAALSLVLMIQGCCQTISSNLKLWLLNFRLRKMCPCAQSQENLYGTHIWNTSYKSA